MSAIARPGLVSVVVASYNHAEYLAERMDTLLAQTYAQLEIIVIDDCSPDDSLAVLRRYQDDPRVRLVVREKNGGWVAVSNQGVELATGEFVLFANCDDACEPQMIERLVDALRRHPSAGIAFCRSQFIDEHGRDQGDDFATREPAFQALCASDALIDRRRMSRFLLDSCAIPNLSAALFRKQCFADVGVLSAGYRVVSDWDLYFRIAAAYDVAYVAAPLNRFRQHETTIRSILKERVINDETLRLLLQQLRALPLSAGERSRYRLRIMHIWAIYLVAPSWSGLQNFPFHLRRVAQLDPLSLLYLPPALLLRAAEVGAKLVGLRSRAAAAA